tara:strand:- start:41 stop:790 length:750 start_codon:yes stop_codon:yes gene_type:complete
MVDDIYGEDLNKEMEDMSTPFKQEGNGVTGDMRKSSNRKYNSLFDNFVKEDGSLDYVSTGLGIAQAGLITSQMFDKSYDKTISNLESALSDLQTAKSNIGGQLNANLSEARTDLSDLNALSSVSLMQQNKSQFRELSDVSSDFSMGRIESMKDDLLSNINARLKNQFNQNQMRTEKIIEQNVNDARATISKVNASMDSIKDEIKEVKDAKKNRFRNTLTDLTALASTYYDPTGITGSIIRSTKPKNKYS